MLAKGSGGERLLVGTKMREKVMGSVHIRLSPQQACLAQRSVPQPPQTAEVVIGIGVRSDIIIIRMISFRQEGRVSIHKLSTTKTLVMIIGFGSSPSVTSSGVSGSALPPGATTDCRSDNYYSRE